MQIFIFHFLTKPQATQTHFHYEINPSLQPLYDSKKI